MNFRVSYFDNLITIEENQILAIEIENKKYFYRLINDLYRINENDTENISIFDSNQNYNDKIKIFLNYFDLEINSKKTLTDLIKYISNTISQEEKDILQKEFIKIVRKYKQIINSIDLPITIDEEINVSSISKSLKIRIKENDELLDNLFLLIDIENIFKTNNILVFVNLKQYLTKEEINELYKYSIYNQVKIILIDSQSYGTTLKKERKLIIDENLDEFML